MVKNEQISKVYKNALFYAIPVYLGYLANKFLGNKKSRIYNYFQKTMKVKPRVVVVSRHQDWEVTSKPYVPSHKRALLIGLKGAGKSMLKHQLLVANKRELDYPISNSKLSSVFTLNSGRKRCYIQQINGVEDLLKYWDSLTFLISLIIFVIDSSDINKLPEATKLFLQTMCHPLLETVPVLLVASKQDRLNALKPKEVEKVLNVPIIIQCNRKIRIIGCQTYPLPTNKKKFTKTWYHQSIGELRRKILDMIGF